MPDIVDQPHQKAAREITRLTAIYRDIEDLVNIGAYAPGANPEFDLAVKMKKQIDQFLQQDVKQKITLEESIAALMHLENLVNDTAQELTPAGSTNQKNNAAPNSKTPAQSSPTGMGRMMAGV